MPVQARATETAAHVDGSMILFLFQFLFFCFPLKDSAPSF